MTFPAIPVVSSIAELTRRYDAWLTDIWGVMHNGLKPFPSAVEACQIFRQGGGTVVLISNSPRPSHTAAEQLREIGVADDSYDAIATSGDVTRKLICSYAGQTIYHLGPERDIPIYEDTGVILGGPDDCEAIICTGLFDDEQETPEDYNELLTGLRDRKVPMICANPDLLVERGDRLIYCAGSLAKAYEALSGETVYAGKPHPPIYALAFNRLRELQRPVPRQRILAIGDGLHTDIPGAAAADIDSVYIASAVHMPGGKDGLRDGGILTELFGGIETRPIAAMSQLRW